MREEEGKRNMREKKERKRKKESTGIPPSFCGIEPARKEYQHSNHRPSRTRKKKCQESSISCPAFLRTLYLTYICGLGRKKPHYTQRGFIEMPGDLLRHGFMYSILVRQKKRNIFSVTPLAFTNKQTVDHNDHTSDSNKQTANNNDHTPISNKQRADNHDHTPGF